MTNFIFKSSARTTDLQKISQLINLALNEQRHQRSDLSEIKFMINKLLTNKDLKDQVDKYYGPTADPLPGD